MEVTTSDSEKKPLLESTCPQKVDNDLKLGVPKPLALFLCINVVLFQVISYILSMYVMNQYSYQAYMKQRYPNSTLHSTGNQSICSVDTNSTEYKQQVVVQKLTSEWNMYCALVSNVPGILITVNLASFSDVYGRKSFFLVPLIGTFLKNALCAIGIYFNFNIAYFIIFYAVEGCTGTWVSTLSMVYCYIADLTEPGKPRTIVIGLLELGIGIGAFVSTTMSGYLIKWTDGFFYPLVASVSAVVLALMVVMCLLPESLPQSKRHNKVSIVQNFVRVTECYRSNFSPLAKPWVFITLIVLFITSGFGNLGRLQVETLYQLNSPFCWDSVRIGWYGALRLGMLSAGGLAIIKIFHCFTTDEYIALAGCVTTVASCVMTGLANTDSMLYIAAVLSIGSTVTMPMVRTIMSRLAPVHKQGSVFAGVASVEIVTNLASGLGANAVYDATVGIYRGLTFFIMAGYGVFSIMLSLALIIGQWGQKHEEVSVTVNPTMKHRVEEKARENDQHVQIYNPN